MRHPTDRLDAFLEGALPTTERSRIEEHLATCARCAGELRELRGTVELLHALPAPQAPGRIAERVLRRIEAGEARPEGALAAAARRLAEAAPLPLAAAVAGLLVLSVLRAQVQTAEPSALALRTPVRSLPREPAGSSADRAHGPDAALREPSGPGLARRRATAPAPAWSVASGAHAAPFRPDAFDPLVDPAAGRSAALPPRPALELCRRFGADGAGEAGFACRPWLAGMLTIAQYDPHAFAREVARLPENEHEAWVGELARFAARSGDLARVVGALRAASDPRAAALAVRFERASRTLASAE
jgi:hypothetical protein